MVFPIGHVGSLSVQSSSSSELRTFGGGNLLFDLVIFVIGGFLYGGQLETDYGGAFVNWLMGGLLLVLFTYVVSIVMVLLCIPILGQLVAYWAFTNNWYGAILGFVHIPETWATVGVWWILVVLGIIMGAILVIALIMLLVLVAKR